MSNSIKNHLLQHKVLFIWFLVTILNSAERQPAVTDTGVTGVVVHYAILLVLAMAIFAFSIGSVRNENDSKNCQEDESED